MTHYMPERAPQTKDAGQSGRGARGVAAVGLAAIVCG